MQHQTYLYVMIPKYPDFQTINIKDAGNCVQAICLFMFSLTKGQCKFRVGLVVFN